MIFDDEENNENEISEYNPYDNMSSFEDSQNNVNNIEEINIPVSSENQEEYYFNNVETDYIEENAQNLNSDDDNFENPSFVDYENNGNDNNNNGDVITEEGQINENKKTLTEELDEADDDDETKIENYYERKISPEQAARSSAKPKQINKRFLAIVIVVVIGGALLFTFLMPTKSKASSSEAEKKVASKKNLTNYEALANHQGYSDNQSTLTTTERKTEYDENEDVIIPPVIQEQKPTYSQAKTYSSGTSSTSVEIPNTRNDSLHEKTISGIKGLTSTQQNYSTDYLTQVERNVASTQRQSNFSLPSQQEFMNTAMNAYSTYANDNAYANQNDQSGKNSFFNKNKNDETVGQGKWLDLNTIWQGTILEAILTSEMNTDLPGEITARVAKNVYSSQDGRFLLIPQNSILYGTYNSSISYSQKRVQVGWHTLIRPDGYQINLGNMNATDAKGASGLKGFVNDHPFAYLKAIGLMSVFSIINSEFQNSMGSTNNEYVQNILANSQEVTNELGEKLIDRAMNVQPTIIIKAGTKINIVASQTLSLPPCEEIPIKEKYKKY